MKKRNIALMILIIIGLVIYIVNPFKVDIPVIGFKKTSDIVETLKLNDKKITVTYFKGDMIDEEISYNNTFEKLISIKNTNKETVSYSINLSESAISDEKLVFSLLFSSKKEGPYTDVITDKSISGDYSLKYNLGIEAGKTQYLKVVFKSLNEAETTKLKGKISINNNLTKKDVFHNNVADTYHAVEKKIDSLNGIRNPGFYMTDVKNFNLEDSDLSGYVLLDATDISNISYYFTVYNDSYMLFKYLYNNAFSKKDIRDLDYGVLGNLDFGSVCYSYTKKGCSDIMDLPVNTGGSKKDFKVSVDKVYEEVKQNFDTKDKSIVIYNVETDLSNTYGLRGYVLIKNDGETPEYYLYLTNDIFMIAGYNITKLGTFDSSSTAIRAYLPSTWQVSSASPSTVCSFTGLSGCKDKSGNYI